MISILANIDIFCPEPKPIKNCNESIFQMSIQHLIIAPEKDENN